MSGPVLGVDALKEFIDTWVWTEQNAESRLWNVYIKEDGKEALMGFMDLDERTANDIVDRLRGSLWYFSQESMAMLVGLEKEDE